MNELKIVKITHKEADIKARGLFTLPHEERSAFYLQLRDYFNVQEALIISTCNRTEIYYVHPEKLDQKIIKLLCALKGLQAAEYQHFFSAISDGQQTLKHLYRVAIGLESQVLGDIQIFGQVKQAYQESNDLGMCQTLMHRALHTLFFTHKQVCQETEFKNGAVSVSYSAVKLIKKKKLGGENPNILVVGAGKMGADVCKNLNMLGFRQISLTNRTLQKALDLKAELSMEVIPFHEFIGILDQFDIVISTIESPKPIFTSPILDKVSKKKPLACLDLSAPQSFENGFLNRFSGQYFNLDQIGQYSEDTLQQRQKEIPKVEKLILQSIADLSQWVEEYHFTRQIKQFKSTLDQLRKRAMAAHLKKLDPDYHEHMEEFSKSLIDLIVKLPAVQLRQVCERDRAHELSETLNHLFNLEHHQFTNHKQKRL
ncbi:glutamyl-tRNA reductase [Echinicola jeungdonensis]|uniref:Glutamyl-tRNA reductase n=1 Tax=Echinicola jeungdonensis TaxID=709343 RepID=A0ABV5J799_9BACT|nr:glutamyl-tRNA reductase [Echinicola jeungdonensis]MDN3669143.1 glutamyl-tRNA reductase [Echinicola jeungdonensis]